MTIIVPLFRVFIPSHNICYFFHDDPFCGGPRAATHPSLGAIGIAVDGKSFYLETRGRWFGAAADAVCLQQTDL